ncbi:hypothetical protein GCM10011348_27740 [Marinobacterium nitratireducens]|uniref:Uncharacterized protein n=1 Tax=Marinobacterium nitratireducens TaxID=518897 RepID=A0A918DV17_9GAMM|nr:hypothetical protein [Marinobacterium nitratireducens]GGO83593.1 hypothetical protein GCM10011348_27740 [Marinobacterium nitratireducens]
MTSHPLLPMPAASTEISDSYALLGRALAYATEFENNCRTLAHLTDVISSESEYSYEIYSLLASGTLYEKIRALSSKYELPERAEDAIQLARKARNVIAHSISNEHKSLLSTSDGRSFFRANVFAEMDALIEGNQLVEDMIRLFSQGSSLSYGSERIEYFFAICEWLDGKNK